ncbi:MAG: tRNA (adenosine(37)-N6)-threonylcarbamoyltransferase complex dimerization subunit type 1 TsaB [Lachnospiraceae bacterium]|nr:tRNA (adenosine(37)-N6)-threonylcarbamoyltransferase complex dimerization subunit type 1 TsaB [Lachnospiraceae bacterium]
MKILAIDTSGLVCAAAVTDNGQLLAEYRTQLKKTHSQMLLPMLDALRQAIDLDLSTIDCIAVAEGPGSFTGLRIGAATAKGLAFALGIPVVPVPTLDAMAWQLLGEPGTVCPMMDARRGQVYTGLYRFGDTPRTMETLFAPAAVSAEEIAERVNAIGEPAVFLGDGEPVYRETLARVCTVPYRVAPSWKNRQSAAVLADLADVLAGAGGMVDADTFAPVYLRASQAEREAAEKAARAAKTGQTGTGEQID